MTASHGEHRIQLRTGSRAGAVVYEPAGTAAAPPLVLIPGVNGDKGLFSTLAPRLTAGRSVIAVDLGDRVAAGHTVIDSAAHDVEEMLEVLSPGPVDILGQSFGSIVAVRLWRRRSVRRVVLAPPAVLPRRGLILLASWTVKAALVRLWPVTREESLRRFLARTGGYTLEPDLGKEELGNLMRRVRRVRVWPLVRRMLSVPGHSWEREMDGVTAPVLVIEGAREMATLPPGLLGFFRQRADTEVAIVAGGHMPFLTHPEEFQNAVIEFLDRGRVLP